MQFLLGPNFDSSYFASNEQTDSLFWPVFVIATIAAMIASQAMISATFSCVKQAMALGCFPRLKIIHTSRKLMGQIYIPVINWFLMIDHVCNCCFHLSQHYRYRQCIWLATFLPPTPLFSLFAPLIPEKCLLVYSKYSFVLFIQFSLFFSERPETHSYLYWGYKWHLNFLVNKY